MTLARNAVALLALQHVVSLHASGRKIVTTNFFSSDCRYCTSGGIPPLRSLVVRHLREILMAAKLTVLIPCKDERRNIRPCIESVRSIADELLDRRLRLDRRHARHRARHLRELDGDCRLIEREYVNSADFKNWAIPQAKHEWVLVVDADERVPPQLAEEIRARARQSAAGHRRLLDRPRQPLPRPSHSPLRLEHGRRAAALSPRRRATIRSAGSTRKSKWKTAARERLNTAFLHYTTWNTDDYLFKMNRYAAWGALNFRDEKGRKTAGILPMITRAPLRFLQLYVLRLGFLDGIPGLQVCMITAFYSFLKQAKLWELRNAIPQPDPEAERALALETSRHDRFRHGAAIARRSEARKRNERRRAA